MAEGITTMFGKAYDTVGSADKNLVLLTRGDLKVRWGNKYIDLIKNGKINVDVDLLKKVDSKESIYKDGLYLIEKENNNEVWLSIGGSLVNLLGEVGTTYVSFLALQEVTVDLKQMALTNIGFYYETLDKAKEANIKSGIVFVMDEQQLYKVKEGSFSKYDLDLTVPNPLLLENLTINGTTGRIYGTSAFQLGIGEANYISIGSDKVTVEKEMVIQGDLLSSDYVVNKDGYRLYMDDTGVATLEIDKVIIRELLVYNEVIDVLYSDLLRLISESQLIPTKKYRIIDFQNEWEITLNPQYEDITTSTNPVQGKAKNVWPIVVRAQTNSSLYKEFYFSENEKWTGEYDVDFHHLVRTENDSGGKPVNLFSKGRITKLVDEKGNQGNYDFKHKLFKHTAASDDTNTWFYTFNIVNPEYGLDTMRPYTYKNMYVNADASQYNDNIVNNIIYIALPKLEDTTITNATGATENVKRIVPTEDGIIFPDCSTKYPYNNSILGSSGKYVITNDFYNNKMLGIYKTTEGAVEFTLSFHDNTFQKITDCVLNAPMLFNTFDKDLLNVNFKCDQMMNNHITGTISTNNSATTYPIEATNFNDNTINNITTSAIKCYGCNIIKNIIHNIINCFISNTNLENNEIQDITGDSSEIPGGDTPGGDPVNPGGDDPVNPGGNDPVNPSDSVTIITSEPSTTAVNDIMHGTHTNSNPLANTSSSNQVLGYIEDTVSSSYGTPTIYGVYINENASMLSSVSVVPSSTSGHSYDIVGNITSNSTTSIKKVHVWVQFADANQLGYVSVYQAAGSGSVTPGGDTPSGDTPTADSTLDTFIDKITGGASGSVKSTVLANKISAQDTPNTYSYLQLGYNFVSGKSDVLKSWMLANMLAELTPYVNETSGICYETDPLQTGTDTATDYFVNAAEHFGQRRLNYINSESIYMDRINGAAQYSLFKHSDYSGTNSAAAAARTELYNKGVTQAVLRTNRTNLVFDREAAPHAFTIAPIGAPSNDIGSPDQVFTLSMITQYPTPESTGGTPLKDKELDANYLCNILGIDADRYADFLNVCNDIGDAGGNPFKYTYARARPGTWYRLNGNSGFTVPSGGSVYLCDCGIEFEDQSHSDYEDGYNADCSATNNGETYCEKDTRSFTDPSARNDAPNHGNPYKSYQSGHSTRAFMDLLLTLEVVGDTMSGGGSRIERIHQYCLNRVIVRAHWKSDTIAGRFAASMQIGYLNGYKAFHDKIAAL